MALERGSLNVPSLNEINSMGNLAIDFTFLYIRGPWSVENRERNWRRRTLSRDRKLNYLSLTVPDEKKKRGIGFWSLPDFLIHLIQIFSFSRSLRHVLLIRGQKMGCNSRLHLGFFAPYFPFFVGGKVSCQNNLSRWLPFVNVCYLSDFGAQIHSLTSVVW